jgi:hypothetical protein
LIEPVRRVVTLGSGWLVCEALSTPSEAWTPKSRKAMREEFGSRWVASAWRAERQVTRVRSVRNVRLEEATTRLAGFGLELVSGMACVWSICPKDARGKRKLMVDEIRGRIPGGVRV